jgi:hypothetical protein
MGQPQFRRLQITEPIPFLKQRYNLKIEDAFAFSAHVSLLFKYSGIRYGIRYDTGHVSEWQESHHQAWVYLGDTPNLCVLSPSVSGQGYG